MLAGVSPCTLLYACDLQKIIDESADLLAPYTAQNTGQFDAFVQTFLLLLPSGYTLTQHCTEN